MAVTTAPTHTSRQRITTLGSSLKMQANRIVSTKTETHQSNVRQGHSGTQALFAWVRSDAPEMTELIAKEASRNTPTPTTISTDQTYCRKNAATAYPGRCSTSQ